MNVYEDGKADVRQSDAPDVKPEHSLFRKRYRQLSPEEVKLHDAIKDTADKLALLIEKVGDTTNMERRPGLIGAVSSNQGANLTLALRHLEDAVYRAVKALTA